MQTARPETPTSTSNAIQEALEGEQFESLEEANQFLAQQSHLQNSRVIDDFVGLSPDQIHRFLHAPYDSPHHISFTEQFSEQPEAPILTLFKLLVEALGEEGAKATTKGNLPIKLCRNLADQYWDDDHAYMRKFSSETDFNELHALRLTAKMAGLIHKYKGRFVMTAKCKKLIKQQGIAGIYLPLLKAYTTKFNWGFRDGYDEFNIIQQSFLFTLYLLQQFGGEWRPEQFYTERMIQAFPMVMQEVHPDDCAYSEPDDIINSVYSIRAIERFALFFGLAEIERVGQGRQSHSEIRKTPLLFELLHFHTYNERPN
jgi:hypothetical protein